MSVRTHLPSLLVGFLAFALDRGHKFAQVDLAHWHGGEIVPVTPFFNYVLVWNTGVSYGLLGDLPVWALGLVAAIAIVALGTWWWCTRDTLVRFGLMLVIGGANTVTGAVAGTILITFAYEGLRGTEGALNAGATGAGQVVGLTEIVLALAMIAVMIVKPGGLFPNREIGHILTRARRRQEKAP